MTAHPLAGEVWLVRLSPVEGHEQAGARPSVVISGNQFNEMPHGLRIIVPITTRDRGIPFHLRVEPPVGGVRATSFVLTDQARTVSIRRFMQHWGAIDASLLASLRDQVHQFLIYD